MNKDNKIEKIVAPRFTKENGFSTSDGSGNTITYNLFNLPASIQGKSLSYVYDADGTKLKK